MDSSVFNSRTFCSSLKSWYTFYTETKKILFPTASKSWSPMQPERIYKGSSSTKWNHPFRNGASRFSSYLSSFYTLQFFTLQKPNSGERRKRTTLSESVLNWGCVFHSLSLSLSLSLPSLLSWREPKRKEREERERREKERRERVNLQNHLLHFSKRWEGGKSGAALLLLLLRKSWLIKLVCLELKDSSLSPFKTWSTFFPTQPSVGLSSRAIQSH